MLNAEKWKKEILDITEGGYYFAVSKDRQNIARSCDGLKCENCIFDEEDDRDCGCNFSRMKWLLSEYKEPIKLTRTEYSLLRHVYKLNYKYIARDKNGNISVYLDEPDKDILTEFWHGKEYEITLFNNLFPFIKWEDKEPIRIKEVLNNCEVIEDDL
jgi:hypothetical protein